MPGILNSLNAHNLLIFQPILIILVSKFMVDRALPDKTYLLLGLLSPLRNRLALAVNCCVIIHCLEVSCKEDQIASAQLVIYLRTTDRQAVNYYSTIHAVELIYFDSSKQETTKTHLKYSASSHFPPLH